MKFIQILETEETAEELIKQGYHIAKNSNLNKSEWKKLLKVKNLEQLTDVIDTFRDNSFIHSYISAHYKNQQEFLNDIKGAKGVYVGKFKPRRLV